MISFYSIKKSDKKIETKIIKSIKQVIKKNNFILGKEVFDFENKFKKYCNSKYAISCSNGTDAITLALISLNLKKDSEVIIPAMTYCSTAFAVLNANLKPILVDTGSLSPTIDINQIKKKITKKTKVIMPVHLYGSVSNIKKIKQLIKKKNIYIVDDCAQAHGALDDSGKKVGSIADISTFSLYPGKNLGAYGDAGIITTNNQSIYKKIRKIRNLGSETKFLHDTIGLNSRLDTIQAIIVDKKLRNLNRYNTKRRSIAAFYNKNIRNVKITKLNYSKSCVYHQYVILVNNRRNLIKLFDKKRIQYGFHYPYAIHQLSVFKKKFKDKSFKNAEILAKNSISLPIDPNLSKNELTYIVKTLNEF